MMHRGEWLRGTRQRGARIAQRFVVAGTVDPFGTPDELRDAILLIPALTDVITVETAGRDLCRDRFDLAPVLAAVERLR
jgi:hypothetical protein